MNSEKPRTIELTLSEGNVNDAFTSLLLATGHMHDGEAITAFEMDKGNNNLRNLRVTIVKEVKSS